MHRPTVLHNEELSSLNVNSDKVGTLFYTDCQMIQFIVSVRSDLFSGKRMAK